jgi:hypothetical protein
VSAEANLALPRWMEIIPPSASNHAEVLEALAAWCNAQPGAATLHLMQTVDVHTTRGVRTVQRAWQIAVWQNEDPSGGASVLWCAAGRGLENIALEALAFLRRKAREAVS